MATAALAVCCLVTAATAVETAGAPEKDEWIRFFLPDSGSDGLRISSLLPTSNNSYPVRDAAAVGREWDLRRHGIAMGSSPELVAPESDFQAADWYHRPTVDRLITAGAGIVAKLHGCKNATAPPPRGGSVAAYRAIYTNAYRMVNHRLVPIPAEQRGAPWPAASEWRVSDGGMVLPVQQGAPFHSDGGSRHMVTLWLPIIFDSVEQWPLVFADPRTIEGFFLLLLLVAAPALCDSEHSQVVDTHGQKTRPAARGIRRTTSYIANHSCFFGKACDWATTLYGTMAALSMPPASSLTEHHTVPPVPPCLWTTHVITAMAQTATSISSNPNYSDIFSLQAVPHRPAPLESHPLSCQDYEWPFGIRGNSWDVLGPPGDFEHKLTKCMIISIQCGCSMAIMNQYIRLRFGMQVFVSLGIKENPAPHLPRCLIVWASRLARPHLPALCVLAGPALGTCAPTWTCLSRYPFVTVLR